MKPSTAWTAAAIAVVVLVAVLAWPSAETPAPDAAESPPAQVLALPSAPAGSAPPAGPAAAQPVLLAGAKMMVVDLCGLGRFSAAAPAADDEEPLDLESLPGPVGREPLAAARATLLAQLRQGDARARAAALLLSPPEGDDPAAEQAWSRQLLQLAQSSGQPEVLGWAESACATQPDPMACRHGLIRARLKLEPDNAAHWAALADADPSASDEAWRGLLRSRRWQERPQSLLLAAQAALPDSLPGYLRLALGAEMRLRAPAPSGGGEGFMQERCQQHGRTEECGALARLLSERSDALRTLSNATALAQAAGWPADHQQRLRAEAERLARASPTWWRRQGQPMACATVQSWQQHLTEVARVGEVAALRELSARQAAASAVQ
ncbi:hypothetical protein J2X20_000788 [Pelomonas saccharophila]|uniref:Secreted protein n=1 Tax=Roseateles saccharophilus TaxID=304 RepID=A0ABU1YH24_ROSSA|nr:hypothetical protein [Roseateles saccharophilus]MDR7268159.1 hypothetical protein [Roseateles saccharophilus]